jgi:PAS domain S-box-containing protein
MFLILGFDPDRGVPDYETFMETLHPDDRDMFEEAFQRAITGTPFNIEARKMFPDGPNHWFNTQGFPRTNKEGKIVELFGTLQDITERKQAEETLRFTKYAIDKAIDQAFWMTEDGRLFYVNGAACRSLGYSREELLRLSAPDIASPHKAFNEHWRDLRKHGSITFESLCRAKDGHTFPVEVRANHVIFDGKEYNCAFVTDITERKRMEQSLRESEGFQRALLWTIPDLIWLKDPNGVFLACNAMFERLYGAKEEDIVGKTDYDFVEKDMADFFRERDSMAIATGKPTSNEEWVTYADDGHRALLETIKTPMFDDQGNLIGVLGVARDITERKKADEEKMELRSKLQQAQKMESVGRLAGGVAHDFNNMLGVILGYGELALEQADPALQLHGALKEIMKAARRSADITRQLLAFARKQTVSPKVLDINKTVTGMTSMLHRFIGENIDLVWLPGDAVWPVRMDPGQLDQIMANLCVNARDAIADVGKVTIETGNVEFDETYCSHHYGFLPGEYVLLAVSDNGCGIDAETLRNIFEPFYTTKGSGEGTGLGLATIYGIVKQNNGFINVYSEPDQGTIFKIYLPRHRTETDTLIEKEMEQPAEGGNETILLVEDEPAILEMTTKMLERLDYKVIASRTPSEAIHLAREYEGELHLLVTDLVMPEMNGRDLAKRLLSIRSDIRCLFMSGYTANVIAHHGVLDEGVNFIQKPFSKQQLGAKVREALGKDQIQSRD